MSANDSPEVPESDDGSLSEQAPLLSFVLLREAVLPDADELCAVARSVGLPLGDEAPEVKDETLVIALEGEGSLLISLMNAPHPDAAEMPPGLTSPPPEEIEEQVAHYIVVLVGVEGEPLELDLLACRALSSVVRSSPAIAAMFGRGAVFHAAELFEAVDDEISIEQPPIELLIDMTVADEGNGRLSILTHGMPRYGRENLLVHAPHAQGQDAAELGFQLISWLLLDPSKEFPTGDTVGRTAREKHRIDRGPNPIDADETVMIVRM
jgi:hypothetical protein